MENAETLMPLELVERTILVIRGQKVIIDADLATLYGVTTKRLKAQILSSAAFRVYRTWGHHGCKRIEHAACH